MLTYAERVREEIFSSKPSKNKNYISFCYGLLLMSRRFDEECAAITTEHLTVSKLYGFAVRDCCGERAAFTQHQTTRGDILYSAALTDRVAIKRLMNHFSHSEALSNRALMEEDSFAAFFTGVFLACGAISEPEKSYRMELLPPSDMLCDLLFEILSTAGYPPKASRRREETVLYFKESGQIEDLLTMMGAVKCSLELMETKIYKDLRNRANRATNCETANIDKLVKASVAQLEDINLLAEADLLRSLPPPLAEMAELRRQNPSAALTELAQLAGISRSGANHRLKRISEAASQLRKG